MKTSPRTPKAPGIYRISVGPRTFYWGQSGNLRARAVAHISRLVNDAHPNRHLQASFNTHGEAAFSFEVVLVCEIKELNRYEQSFIDRYHGTPGCANIAKDVEAPCRGVKLSEAHRAKISAAHTGKTYSDETRAKMSAWQRGRTLPPETIAKMSEARRGVKMSPEAAAAIRGGTRAVHPNIRVERTCGAVEVWPSQSALAQSLGRKNTGSVSRWLSGRRPIPAKYNIVSVSRTNLPATINPESL